jgi:phosphoserine phosphatase RsbU/P
VIDDDSRPLRVLLVEDDPDDARATSGLLHAAAESGVEVVHVESAEDALARLDAGPAVDAVVLGVVRDSGQIGRAHV